MKHCPKCGADKPHGEFYQNKSQANGISTYCKMCHREKMREWREANPEKYRAMRRRQKKAYAKRHPEKVKAKRRERYWKDPDKSRAAGRASYYRHQEERAVTAKAYYEKNRERWLAYSRERYPAYYQANKKRIAARSRAWKKAHPEKNRLWAKQWREANPEKWKLSRKKYEKKCLRIHPEINRMKGARRRARIRGVQERFTAAMMRFSLGFWGHKCAACGREREPLFENRLHIDHWLPLSKGHALTMKNAVLLCNHCNGNKRDRLPREVFSEKVVRRIGGKLVEQMKSWEAERQVKATS